jgi:hypothetical protein
MWTYQGGRPGHLLVEDEPPGNVALRNRRNALWKEDIVNVVHLVTKTWIEYWTKVYDIIVFRFPHMWTNQGASG